MRKLILAPIIAGCISWGLLSTATTPGGALTAATGLSACVAALVLIPAWRIARADITRRRTT
jgi:hypothetical protein